MRRSASCESPAPGAARGLAPSIRCSLALHAVAGLGLAARPGAWPLVTALLVADHAALLVGGLLPRSRLLGPNLTRIGSAGNGVALTFDDGPDPEVTPAVLDELDRWGARATFFVVGQRAERHDAVVQEVARRGHAVENHSYRHRAGFFFCTPRQLAQELGRTQELLCSLTGVRPRYFRAPAGIRSPWLDPVLARHGLRLVSWTRRGFDTLRHDPERIASSLLAAVEAGDVLLLHDGASPRGGSGRAVVLDALPLVLEGLAEGGLCSVVLPDPQGE